MVETSLVLTVFLCMVVAIMDFAQFLFVHQSLVEASRAAARYGAVNAYNEQAIVNVVLYDSAVAPADPRARFNLDASMVAVRRLDSGSSSDRVEVKISNYPFQVYTPMIAGTLRGLAITTTLPYEIR